MNFPLSFRRTQSNTVLNLPLHTPANTNNTWNYLLVLVLKTILVLHGDDDNAMGGVGEGESNAGGGCSDGDDDDDDDGVDESAYADDTN